MPVGLIVLLGLGGSVMGQGAERPSAAAGQPSLWFRLYSYADGETRAVTVDEEGGVLFVEATDPNIETGHVVRVHQGALPDPLLADVRAAILELSETDTVETQRPVEALDYPGQLIDAAMDVDGSPMSWSRLRGDLLPSSIVASLEAVADAAEGLPEARAPAIIVAERVTPERADRIDRYEFVPVNPKELTAVQGVSEALSLPGSFVVLEDAAAAHLLDWQAESNPEALGPSVFLTVETPELRGMYQIILLELP